MKENQTNRNGMKSVYEPVEVQVCAVAPAGVLCQSGGYGVDAVSVLGDDSGNWM